MTNNVLPNNGFKNLANNSGETNGTIVFRRMAIALLEYWNNIFNFPVEWKVTFIK